MKDKTLRFIVGVICLALASLVIISQDVIATSNESIWEGSKQGTLTDGSVNNFVMRGLVLSNITNGTATAIRVKFSAHSGQNFATDSNGYVYIAEVDETKGLYGVKSTTVKNLTFSGNQYFSILAGQTIFSDWVTYAFDNDKNYSVTLHLGAANAGTKSPASGIDNFAVGKSMAGDYTLLYDWDWSGDSVSIYTNMYVGVTEIEGTIGSGSGPFYSSLSLNTPSNLNRTINYTQQINFTFTPLFNETIINCTLFTNESGVFIPRANKTGVQNNTRTGISSQYNTTDTEGAIIWNVYCLGNSSNAFASANFTVNIDRTAPSITVNIPSSNSYDLNRSFFKFNYTATDLIANLYRGNLTLYYANKTFIKNLLYYNDLNVSTLNEQRYFNWSEEPKGVDYFVELCFSDDEASSPPMKFLKAENRGILKQNKDELHITDSETGADIIAYLEFSDGSKISKSNFELVNYKTKDDKHIIFGGSYPKNKILKDIKLRYRYHSNNEQKLILVDSSIGLIHSESDGMRNIFIQHRSLIEKGFNINSFYDGSDIIVEFWKEEYKDVVDFDPLIGGLNINCINSSNITKPYFLNFNASDYYTGENISNFSVTITNSYGDVLNDATTNGTLFFPVKNTTYTVNATSKGFLNYSVSLSIGSDLNNTLLFKRNNSIYAQIKDETTGLLITENVTIRVSNVYGESIYYTTSGAYYLYDLIAADYTLRFSSVSYSERSFNQSVSNGTSILLTAFLAKNTEETILTILDSDTAATVEGASIIMERTINSTWQTVESRNSDITGRAQFNYILSTKYRFTVTKSGYDTKIFTLDPILFSSYDVYINKILSLNNTLDYDQVIISISPTTYEMGTNVFTIMFYSPYDNLITYGYNLSYPTGVAGGSGTSTSGESFSRAFNVTPQPFDTVTLNYFYQSDVSGFKNFTVSYPINYINNNTYNMTMMSNKNKTYGLGLLERILIATMLILLVVGLGTLYGKALPSLVIGILLWGYFSYIGFIPFWAIALPLVAGLLLLIFGGNQYG